MTRRANCTRRSTRLRGRVEGEDGAEVSSANRTAARASKARGSSMAWKPTWSRWHWLMTSTRSRRAAALLPPTGRASCRAQLPVHVDHRLSSARVIPRTSRLERPDPRGCEGHHPNRDLGRGPLGLSRRLAYALKQNNNEEAKSEEFIGKLFKNVPVLDSGARGATTTFVQRQIGDVLVTWENEAFGDREARRVRRDMIVPPTSIVASSVAVVEKVADRHGTREIAEAYLKVPLYARGAADGRQHTIAPTVPEVRRRSQRSVAGRVVQASTTCSAVGPKAEEALDDGEDFDRIYKPGREFQAHRWHWSSNDAASCPFRAFAWFSLAYLGSSAHSVAVCSCATATMTWGGSGRR